MYRNWPYQYTDYSMPFEVNQSLSDSMQSLTHIKRSSGFLSQETGTNTFSLSHAKFQQIFPCNFSCKGSLFFVQSSKHLSTYRLRSEHRHFYMATSNRLVSHILTDRGLHSKLLTKQTSFLVQLARIMSRTFTSLFSPATISLANLYKMHTCAQH